MIREISVLLFAGLVLMEPGVAEANDRIIDAGHGEWIKLTGTVESVAREEFMLRHGDRRIIVETDGPSDIGDVDIRLDDEVAVAGRMEKGADEDPSIDASSVHVKNRDEYYYFSAIDEEGTSSSRPGRTGSDALDGGGRGKWPHP